MCGRTTRWPRVLRLGWRCATGGEQRAQRAHLPQLLPHNRCHQVHESGRVCREAEPSRLGSDEGPRSSRFGCDAFTCITTSCVLIRALAFIDRRIEAMGTPLNAGSIRSNHSTYDRRAGDWSVRMR
eukprot:scaffold11197_cov33-Tisochrysis_lutea.AAC.3